MCPYQHFNEQCRQCLRIQTYIGLIHLIDVSSTKSLVKVISFGHLVESSRDRLSRWTQTSRSILDCKIYIRLTKCKVIPLLFFLFPDVVSSRPSVTSDRRARAPDNPHLSLSPVANAKLKKIPSLR